MDTNWHFINHRLSRGILIENIFIEILGVKEHVSRVQNTFCLKSQIEGHKIHQLGGLAKFAANQVSCLAGRFNDCQCRISRKIYSEPLLHALHPVKISLKVFAMYLESCQRAYCDRKRIQAVLIRVKDNFLFKNGSFYCTIFFEYDILCNV